MKKVRTAVIGCGAISDRYLTNLSSMFSIIELVGCCNRTPAKAQRAAEKYGIRCMTLEEILKDESIEMVINLTNPPSHYDVSKQCLLAGKHVYTEKVITVELDQAKELLESMALFMRVAGVSDYTSASVAATDQSIAPGTPVAPGTVVEVRFVSSVIDYGSQDYDW